MRRTLLLAVLAIGLIAAAPAIETVGGERMAIALPGDAPPVAAVILVPGGSTVVSIHDDGTTSNDTNAVMRWRPRLLAAHLAVGYLEDPSYLGAAVARMRSVARSVFVLATSNGTVIALKNAAQLGADGPDGLILTSPVTKYTTPIQMSIDQLDLGAIAQPVLIVHDTNDGCPVSPPDGPATLTARLKAVRDIHTVILTSSQSGPLRTTARELACSPASPHGFLGIDDTVVAAIVPWIAAHASSH